jgi:hypothetical protein
MFIPNRLFKLPLALFYASLPRLCILFIIFVWRSEYAKAPLPLPLDLLPTPLRGLLPHLHPYESYVELVRVGFGSAAAVLALSGKLGIGTTRCPNLASSRPQHFNSMGAHPHLNSCSNRSISVIWARVNRMQLCSETLLINGRRLFRKPMLRHG